MQLSDFDYDLPAGLIAQHPTVNRADARLLVVGRSGLSDQRISGFSNLLRSGDLLVLNDTRVIPARLHGNKDSGGRVEILIERLIDEHQALAQVRASKSPREGARLNLEPDGQLRVTGRQESFFCLRAEEPIAALLERCGEVPLPPYIERAPRDEDRERYQTVFAARPGAVAAPTAGLHLDRRQLEVIAAGGVDIARLTLHVGAGTFQPVRGESIDDHRMHAERIDVSAALCEAVAAAKERGGRVVAVGTTVVRALEAVAARAMPLAPYAGETRIFIRPGFRFQVVDALLTNFHLPRSTLLMLVAAFAGYDSIMQAYRHAVANSYRFFSYGDAMFLERRAADAA